MPNFVSPDKRLCIIGESDPFLARLLQRFAEKDGMQVEVARTGEEVMELIRDGKPTLIILEPELPGKLRGWEAARMLKSSVDLAGIPLMICAWLDKEKALALAGSISAYLQKPDLHYRDFQVALELLGVRTGPESSSRR